MDGSLEAGDVKLAADWPFKMKRCRTKGENPEQIDDKKLRQYIQSVDKRRAQYYQFFTDQIWGNGLSSGRIGYVLFSERIVPAGIDEAEDKQEKSRQAIVQLCLLPSCLLYCLFLLFDNFMPGINTD